MSTQALSVANQALSEGADAAPLKDGVFCCPRYRAKNFNLTKRQARTNVQHRPLRASLRGETWRPEFLASPKKSNCQMQENWQSCSKSGRDIRVHLLFKTDASGYQLIITKTPDGNYHVTKIGSPVGPGDPPVGRRCYPQPQNYFAELDNVAGVSEVQQQVFNLMQQAVLALAQT